MRMRVYRGCLKKGVLKRLKAANCQKAVFLRSPVGRGEPNRCGGTAVAARRYRSSRVARSLRTAIMNESNQLWGS